MGSIPVSGNLNIVYYRNPPAAPAVVSAAGAQTWGYKLIDEFADGHTEPSAEGTTATGALDLTIPGNENVITPPAAPVGLVARYVYRTTAPGGGTPNTVGLVKTLTPAQAAAPFNDNGLAAGAAPPATNTTGVGAAYVLAHVNQSSSIFFASAAVCTFDIEVSNDGIFWGVFSAGFAAGFVVVTPAVKYCRAYMKSYVNGVAALQHYGFCG